MLLPSISTSNLESKSKYDLRRTKHQTVENDTLTAVGTTKSKSYHVPPSKSTEWIKYDLGLQDARNKNSKAQRRYLDFSDLLENNEEFLDDTKEIKPYVFGYDINDPLNGRQFRQESKDGTGAVHGRFGYQDAKGQYRQVDYIADHFGFRANVQTNEAGASAHNAADVNVQKADDPFSFPLDDFKEDIYSAEVIPVYKENVYPMQQPSTNIVHSSGEKVYERIYKPIIYSQLKPAKSKPEFQIPFNSEFKHQNYENNRVVLTAPISKTVIPGIRQQKSSSKYSYVPKFSSKENQWKPSYFPRAKPKKKATSTYQYELAGKGSSYINEPMPTYKNTENNLGRHSYEQIEWPILKDHRNIGMEKDLVKDLDDSQEIFFDSFADEHDDDDLHYSDKEADFEALRKLSNQHTFHNAKQNDIFASFPPTIHHVVQIVNEPVKSTPTTRANYFEPVIKSKIPHFSAEKLQSLKKVQPPKWQRFNHNNKHSQLLETKIYSSEMKKLPALVIPKPATINKSKLPMQNKIKHMSVKGRNAVLEINAEVYKKILENSVPGQNIIAVPVPAASVPSNSFHSKPSNFVVKPTKSKDFQQTESKFDLDKPIGKSQSADGLQTLPQLILQLSRFLKSNPQTKKYAKYYPEKENNQPTQSSVSDIMPSIRQVEAPDLSSSKWIPLTPMWNKIRKNHLARKFSKDREMAASNTKSTKRSF